MTEKDTSTTDTNINDVEETVQDTTVEPDTETHVTEEPAETTAGDSAAQASQEQGEEQVAEQVEEQTAEQAAAAPQEPQEEQQPQARPQDVPQPPEGFTDAQVSQQHPQPPAGYTAQQPNVQYTPVSQPKPKREWKTNELNRIAAIAGWGCIIVAVVALVACLTMYFTNAFPDWAYDTKGSIYTLENYAKQDTEIVAAQAILDSPDSDSESINRAEIDIKLAHDMQSRIKGQVMWRLLMLFGALPSIALFIVWFVFANKQRKSVYCSTTGKQMAKKTILYVVFGCIFFNFLPGLITNIVENIATIIGLIVFCGVGFYVATHMDGGGSGTSSGEPGSTKTKEDALKTSLETGRPQGSTFLGTKPDKSEMKKGYEQGGRVAVKEVPANLPLKRVSTPFWGSAIAFVGADGQDHYVCTQDEYDKGKTVIMDQKGNKRNA